MAIKQRLEHVSTIKTLKALVRKNGMPKGIYIDDGHRYVAVRPKDAPMEKQQPVISQDRIALEDLFKCIVFSRPEERRKETLVWLQQLIFSMPKGESARAAYGAYEKVRDRVYVLKGHGYHYEKGVGVCRSSHHEHQNS